MHLSHDGLLLFKFLINVQEESRHRSILGCYYCISVFFFVHLVARKMKKKEKQKKRKAYEPKLTPEGNILICLYS